TAWRTTFQTLRSDFSKAADSFPALRHLAYEPRRNADSGPPVFDKLIGHHEALQMGLLTAPWDDRRRHGLLTRPESGLRGFERVAERSFLALHGTNDGKLQAFPQMAVTDKWLAFLYRRLARHPGTYLECDEVLWVRYPAPDGQLIEIGIQPQLVERETDEGVI